MISVIIPTYNEEKNIKNTLKSLLSHRNIEIIIVDGQSSDKTVELARNYPVKIFRSEINKGIQMNSGAEEASGEIFLFLHSDCTPEGGAFLAIKDCLSRGYIGGCLSLRIDSDNIIYRFIEASGNIRAKLSKIFYGDQGIFVRRDVFFKIGGFDKVELFEDIIFSKKLKREGKTAILNKKIYASARRWQKQGVIKTTLVYWLLTLGFLFGVSPGTLKKIYSDLR